MVAGYAGLACGVGEGLMGTDEIDEGLMNLRCSNV